VKLPVIVKKISEFVTSPKELAASVKKIAVGTAVAGLALFPMVGASDQKGAVDARDIETKITNRLNRGDAPKMVLAMGELGQSALSVVQHVSHASHSSHSSHYSHRSHYSGF